MDCCRGLRVNQNRRRRCLAMREWKPRGAECAKARLNKPISRLKCAVVHIIALRTSPAIRTLRRQDGARPFAGPAIAVRVTQGTDHPNRREGKAPPAKIGAPAPDDRSKR